ncbi:MAG TPA: PQQ-dependent sugar dehydrogenase [Vicinamibacterales bacterium]|nr:PQQ-dependent sugar dehydrogenase [Vicinamibacterales bacterium]
MTRLQRHITAAVILLAASAPPALAQLKAELFVSGLSAPVAFVQSPTHPNVQLVVEQGGRVRVVQDGVLLAQDFLNLTGTALFDGEQGLLGLAFAPDYASSGRVYVNFVNTSGDTVIARFLRSAGNPLQANTASRFDLVWPDGNPFIDQPAFPNHKGGNIVFGPDGMLYIGMGDGGSGNDPFHLAQNPASLLGKILRIDVGVALSNTKGYAVPPSNPFVGQPGVLGEIWAFGVRNPWKFSFDDPFRGGTGALVMGDVGQGSWEEVNYEPAATGGRNYGWRNREGAHDNVTSQPPFNMMTLTDPIIEYSHVEGRSITGGYVYRGSALGASYAGRYFFADFSFSRVWSIAITNPGTAGAGATNLTEHSGELGAGVTLPSSFGVDSNGELYVVSYAGSIYRISLNSAPGAGSCPTVQPGPDWVCVNGNWLPPGFPGTTPPTPPTTPPPTGCTTPQPASDWTCVNGNWLPPGFPGTTPPTPPTTPPPTPPPTGCTTPQPGSDWTCVNGNWLPPGSPGTTPPPPTTPPPTPPPTGCTTPQPASDWTCVNGNWLPPGFPGTTPPTTPPPTPPPTGCTTPQPASDWTCVNGNWLPPGFPGTPPSTPPTTPPPTSCPGSDPFLGLPGLAGVCINGNWIPTELIQGATATVQFHPESGGFWALHLDDGRVFVPMGGLAPAFQTNGRRVTFSGKVRIDLPSTPGAIVEVLQIQ